MEDLRLRRKKMVIHLMGMIVVILFSMKLEYVSADIHYVGGSKTTWAPNINFSDWSSHRLFHLGDWLYFGYNKYQFNVLEVNKTGYENCNDKDFITNITGGAGRDVFQLTQAKTYYFLSGGGYCFQGMKVAVHVLDIPPEPAAPPSDSTANSSPVSASVSHITPLVLLLVVTAWLWNLVII